MAKQFICDKCKKKITGERSNAYIALYTYVKNEDKNISVPYKRLKNNVMNKDLCENCSFEFAKTIVDFFMTNGGC